MEPDQLQLVGFHRPEDLECDPGCELTNFELKAHHRQLPHVVMQPLALPGPLSPLAPVALVHVPPASTALLTALVAGAATVVSVVLDG